MSGLNKAHMVMLHNVHTCMNSGLHLMVIALLISRVMALKVCLCVCDIETGFGQCIFVINSKLLILELMMCSAVSALVLNQPPVKFYEMYNIPAY